MDTADVNEEADWFSACLRLVVLIEHEGATHYADSVVLFHASTWDAAFARALELGRGLETSYRNSDGQEVRWRLASVLTLDHLGPELPDGAEVHWRTKDLAAAREAIAFDVALEPEKSRPGQSGVRPN